MMKKLNVCDGSRAKKELIWSLLLGLNVSILMQGCAYTTAVSTTNIPANRSNKVTASTKRTIILGLVFDNNEVLDLTTKLHDKCPDGAVRGITTHNIVTLYFLAFLWQREVVATGYCVKTINTAQSGDLEEVVSPEAGVATQKPLGDEVKL